MRKRFVLTIGVAASVLCGAYALTADIQKDKEPAIAEAHEGDKVTLERKQLPQPEVEEVKEEPVKKEEPKPQPVVKEEPKPEPKPQPAPEPAKPKGQMIRMEVTGYTAGYESTQKKKGEPGYGITASGEYVKQGRTIAAGKNIPFGTKVYIPYFDNQPGFDDGIFTVEDRGGAIGPYNIDVYYESLTDARNFGRQVLEVYILED